MFEFLKRKPRHATVEPNGGTIIVAPGQKLLDAGLEAGLPWPHDCRVGSCGTCRVVLKSGTVKPLRDFTYTLDADALAAGMILPCQSLLKSDVVVEVDFGASPGQSIEHHAATIADVIPLTHDIVELTLDLGAPGFADALAGQYADVTVDGLDEPRSYSFARAPRLDAANTVRFYVRHVPGGEFTDWLFGGPRTGASVRIAGPYGNFYRRDGHGPIICVAGGSGLAPIHALVEEACERGIERPLVILFGARTQADLYRVAEIEAFGRRWRGAFRFVPVLSEEPDGNAWDGERGLVTDALPALGIDVTGAQGYLCGPPPMVDAGIAALQRLGVAATEIFYDKFEDASTRAQTDAGAARGQA